MRIAPRGSHRVRPSVRATKNERFPIVLALVGIDFSMTEEQAVKLATDLADAVEQHRGKS
ncbi:hypothetical protein HUN08_13225 [Gordonia sp. X0973]|uniref:hypothetical protein n=1 Tax=Gordonia sp. X0973 TaxID=2742602 RepID=UPI000F52C4AC|nr:hypothetical protein [Gordonia sp. X0973]QKT08037.1 hypothetical protein HUN08_13225 [Gordonia sp. X0973]